MTSLDVGISKPGNKTSVGPLGVDNASIPCEASSVVSGGVGETPVPKDGTTVFPCGCTVGSAVDGTTVVPGCICEIPGETVTE